MFMDFRRSVQRL